MSLAGLGDHARALRLSSGAEAEWDRLDIDIQMNFWTQLRERYFGPHHMVTGSRHPTCKKVSKRNRPRYRRPVRRYI